MAMHTFGRMIACRCGKETI
ncbi:hypothetical protein RSAG8_10534, partial [Rhizoctonia solani AG-8 WAC10335]